MMLLLLLLVPLKAKAERAAKAEFETSKDSDGGTGDGADKVIGSEPSTSSDMLFACSMAISRLFRLPFPLKTGSIFFIFFRSI
jgi:hypothetical protein